MSEGKPNRFRISWDRGAYYVNIPNYQGGEVVPAEIADALAKALEAYEAAALCVFGTADHIRLLRTADDRRRAALSSAAPPVEPPAKTEVAL